MKIIKLLNGNIINLLVRASNKIYKTFAIPEEWLRIDVCNNAQKTPHHEKQ